MACRHLCGKSWSSPHSTGGSQSFVLPGPPVLTQTNDSSQWGIIDKMARIFFKVLFCASTLSSWTKTHPTHLGSLWKCFVEMLGYFPQRKKEIYIFFLKIQWSVSSPIQASASSLAQEAEQLWAFAWCAYMGSFPLTIREVCAVTSNCWMRERQPRNKCSIKLVSRRLTLDNMLNAPNSCIHLVVTTSIPCHRKM